MGFAQFGGDRENPRGDFVKDLHTLMAREDARPPEERFRQHAPET
jgi:hypothetical protein